MILHILQLPSQYYLTVCFHKISVDKVCTNLYIVMNKSVNTILNIYMYTKILSANFQVSLESKYMCVWQNINVFT